LAQKISFVPEEKQKSFSSKTRACLFLGYVWNSRSIYKVMDVVTRHIFTTLKFDEYSFPGLPNNSVNPNLFPYREPVSLLVADQLYPFTYDGTSLTEDWILPDHGFDPSNFMDQWR
jgi:hypothetical protein